MEFDRRRFLEASAFALGALAGCGAQQPDETPGTATPTPTATATETPTDTPTGEPPGALQEVTIRQEPGKVFYWVTPGPRDIDEAVFGTPDAPRFGDAVLGQRMAAAEGLPSPLSEAVPTLLEEFPILVAMPEGVRQAEDGEYTTTSTPTPFGDQGVPTAGEFEATLRSARPFDLPGPPGETPNAVDLSASFEDPAGNTYEVVLDHVIQPPFPGYETGGGVMIDAWHHGTSGTGTPFMPQVYTYGAFWALGHVDVNGERAVENHALHLMTTQNVRNKDYELATSAELPLAKGETIGNQIHHTHLFVLPVKAGADGPAFAPVSTAFELPNGETQPFIHAMWEQDTVVDHPFGDWSPDAEGDAVRTAQFRQEAGNAFYWVTPGPRRIDEAVFGTPDAPRFGDARLAQRIEQAKGMPGALSDTVPALLQEFPILVALPEQARKTQGGEYTETSIMTPFGDDGVPTKGQFDVTLRDARPYDQPGAPGETPDSADLQASFEDPAGNAYEVEFDHVIQPPFPGYETGGGVMIDAWHHGTTGTGTPLMPRVYTFGALWGLGNVAINGETRVEMHAIHLMTTQNVRDTEYRLAVSGDLPLAKSKTIGNQIHHTHMFVLPVKGTPEGPVFEPVATAFELPNGQTQPFIHAMWEQDTIVEHPYGGWAPP